MALDITTEAVSRAASSPWSSIPGAYYVVACFNGANILGDALAIVGYRVKVPMPETRRAALGSFVLNVGSSHFSSSTLLKLLNQGQTQAACARAISYPDGSTPMAYTCPGLQSGGVRNARYA